MAQKPVPHSTSATVYVPGELLQMDIKGFADTSQAKKHLRAFGNHEGALTAAYTATGCKLGTLIKSHASLK